MTAASATMRRTSGMKAWAPARLFALALLCAGPGLAHAQDAGANSPGSLRARYGALQEQLSHNQFQRPLYMDSSETPGGVAGEIYALVNYPFATVGAALVQHADSVVDRMSVLDRRQVRLVFRRLFTRLG